MQFPLFVVPWLGNGMTIAIDAVFHVIMSHGFAIGLFTMIVYGEYRAYRDESPAWDEFSYRMLRFATILITSLGAVTGVGIWFFISVLEPRGTGDMLRLFFWPWFIEWAVFTAEVIVIIIYYFTWKRWSETREGKRRHVRLGVSYVVFAILSGVLITGILGFMLTSDGWPWGGSFWQAFFNPTFLPQLVVRLGGAYVLGAFLALAYLVLRRPAEPVPREGLRAYGLTALVAIGVTAAGTAWYFASVPATFRTHTIFSVLTSAFTQQPWLFWVVNAVGLAAILVAAVIAVLRLRRPMTLLVIPAVILAMLFFVEFERAREFIRGPYVMPGYMYANQVLLKETPHFDQQGLLPNSYWFGSTTDTLDVATEGAYLFGQNCTVCHTVQGINGITGRVRGRSQDGILVIVRNTNRMVPFMAPFAGTPDEARTLAAFLYQLSSGQIELTRTSRFMDVRQKKPAEGGGQ